MKKRVHKVANFLAFNLLFFALYLNFIYKDPTGAPAAEKRQQGPAAFSEALTDNKPAATQPAQTPVKPTDIIPAKSTH